MNDNNLKIGAVIQGPWCDNETPKIQRSCLKYFDSVIVSTWNGAPQLDGVTTSDPKIADGMENGAHVGLQVMSALVGTEKIHAEVDYIVKFRSDEFFSNFSKMIETIKQNPNKMITADILVRPWARRKFHASDHYYGAPSKVMLDGLNRMRRYLRREKAWHHGPLTAEVVTHISLLEAAGYAITRESFIENYRLVKVSDLGESVTKWNHRKRTYRNHEWSPGSKNLTDMLEGKSPAP